MSITAEQIREISSEVYWEHNHRIINGLIELKPTMTTKEVCKYLGCERHWLSRNRNLFGGTVINKRGDLNFDATKVVAYKRKELIKKH